MASRFGRREVMVERSYLATTPAPALQASMPRAQKPSARAAVAAGRRGVLILISVVVIGVLVIGSLGLLVNEDEAAAVAALAIAREMGVSIPRDLSVVGWDDSLLCELAARASARPSCQALKYLLLEAS